MSWIDKFTVFILSHGRANNVPTVQTLRKAGYSGRIAIVLDDLDSQVDDYKENFLDVEIVVFSKAKYFGTFDQMDNFGIQPSPIYARNAMWDIARERGLDTFCVMDDDYTKIEHRINSLGDYEKPITTTQANETFKAYCEYLIESGQSVIAMAQGGDFIGGAESNKVKLGLEPLRKMMNVYFFHVDRPITFISTLNDDLTTSLKENQQGNPVLTSMLTSVVQRETQQSAGGLTGIYLDRGTYVKSFYSVIFAPSAVKVAAMGDTTMRIHHEVRWNNIAPKIIRESHKRKQ